MIADSNVKLNENQVTLLKTSIKSLHNTQDWETLTNSIVLQATKIIGGGKGIFFVFDQSIKKLIPHPSYGIDRIELKKLIDKTKSVINEGLLQPLDTYNENEIYYLPYAQQGNFSGVLLLIPQAGKISQDQLQMLNIFMQSVPIVLENSRLYLMMQRKTKSLSMMSQLQQVMIRYSFQEILTEVVEKIGELLNSEMAGIMLYAPERNELVLQKPAFGIWDDEMIEQYRMSLNGTGNAKTVFLSGIPSITTDAKNNPNYNQHLVNLFRAKAILTVPLVVENKRIGIIHAINQKGRGFFTQDDVQILTELAEQLGTLLQGAMELSNSGESTYQREELERHLSEQLIELSINPKSNTEEIKKIGLALNLKFLTYYTVLAIGICDNDRLLELGEDKLKGLLSEKIRQLTPNSVVRSKDGLVIVNTSHENEHEMYDFSKKLLKQLQQFIQKKQHENNGKLYDVFIGIGEPVQTIDRIYYSYTQAIQMINVLPHISELGNIGYYPFSGSWRVLANVAKHDKDQIFSFVNYHLKRINELKDADEMKNTIKYYLKNNGQLKRASEELFVHQNTLKYRIDKIQEITNFDLSDSEIRFNLNLALRLEQLLAEAGSSK